MRKLAVLAVLAAAVVGGAGSASARCPEFNLECTISCNLPHYHPGEGVHTHAQYC